MEGKGRFENDIRGVIKEYKRIINEEEMAEVLWKLANQVLVEKARRNI